jgi:hypothetical protein
MCGDFEVGEKDTYLNLFIHMRLMNVLLHSNLVVPHELIMGSNVKYTIIYTRVLEDTPPTPTIP